MDIHEIANRYDISLKKLRRMSKDGVLKTGKSATPKHWQMVVSDIRKGKMSARSIALAYRSPEKLDELARLTPRDRKVIREHFDLAELPAESLDFVENLAVPFGAAENQPIPLINFINYTKKIIPNHNVPYEYIAVRWMLCCETEIRIDLYAKNLINALFYARQSLSFQGWWHREPNLYGKYRIIYHHPDGRYDL